jgi:beta-galactosidase
VQVSINDGEKETVHFGIRTLSLDAEKGLCINGKPLKLRGACVHHDNGPLGAISTFDVECRKVRKLKEAGFNAIRTAHNPASPAFLAACDEIGMYVLEESFDVWTINKSNFDYANDFAVHWEEDIEALVSKSYNHSSVIIYSIGNEIAETGSAIGSVWGRKIAEKIRSLDGTRYITNAISGMMSCLPALIKFYMAQEMAQMQAAGAKASISAGAAPTGEVNTVMTNMGQRMKQVMLSEIVTKLTEESFGYTDIAGYNYMDLRYDMDKGLFPDRVIVGTESFAAEIDTTWEKVKNNPAVIGDFCWSGWDYLGEAGIGGISCESDSAEDRAKGVYTDYPFMTAMCGDISISGHRLPASYYREIVFGLRKKPYIAVDRPEHYGKTPKGSPWMFTDALESWNFGGYEGKPISVNVYADADEVELLVNGESAGKKTPEHFKCVFDTVYAPGVVKAFGFKNGVAIGEFEIKTLPEDYFEVRAERETLKAGEYAFINIRAAKNVKVKVAVKGAGELFTFGTDDPKATELFSSEERTLRDGRALAIIRGTKAGEIAVTITADGPAEKKITVKVTE